jgi:hypothetical protein
MTKDERKRKRAAAHREYVRKMTWLKKAAKIAIQNQSQLNALLATITDEADRKQMFAAIRADLRFDAIYDFDEVACASE